MLSVQPQLDNLSNAAANRCIEYIQICYSSVQVYIPYLISAKGDSP